MRTIAFFTIVGLLSVLPSWGVPSVGDPPPGGSSSLQQISIYGPADPLPAGTGTFYAVISFGPRYDLYGGLMEFRFLDASGKASQAFSIDPNKSIMPGWGWYPESPPRFEVHGNMLSFVVSSGYYYSLENLPQQDPQGTRDLYMWVPFIYDHPEPGIYSIDAEEQMYLTDLSFLPCEVAPGSVTIVPEPATFLLAGMGLAALPVRKARRRRG